MINCHLSNADSFKAKRVRLRLNLLHNDIATYGSDHKSLSAMLIDAAWARRQDLSSDYSSEDIAFAKKRYAESSSISASDFLPLAPLSTDNYASFDSYVANNFKELLVHWIAGSSIVSQAIQNYRDQEFAVDSISTVSSKSAKLLYSIESNLDEEIEFDDSDITIPITYTFSHKIKNNFCSDSSLSEIYTFTAPYIGTYSTVSLDKDYENYSLNDQYFYLYLDRSSLKLKVVSSSQEDLDFETPYDDASTSEDISKKEAIRTYYQDCYYYLKQFSVNTKINFNISYNYAQAYCIDDYNIHVARNAANYIQKYGLLGSENYCKNWVNGLKNAVASNIEYSFLVNKITFSNGIFTNGDYWSTGTSASTTVESNLYRNDKTNHSSYIVLKVYWSIDNNNMVCFSAKFYHVYLNLYNEVYEVNGPVVYDMDEDWVTFSMRAFVSTKKYADSIKSVSDLSIASSIIN